MIEGKAEEFKGKVGIVVARWNSMITNALLEGAMKALRGQGLKDDQITVVKCPGAFEIPLTSKLLICRDDIEGVLTLGAVIRGDTPHFDYVCNAVTDGVLELNLDFSKPIIFGVLTTDDVKQAQERAGEKGNKGAEGALALLEMISIKKQIS